MMSRVATDGHISAEELQLARQELLHLAAGLVEEGSSDDSAATTTVLETILGSDFCRRVGIYPIPPGFMLSVVIPVYNEVATLEQVIQRVRDTGLNQQIILVDDGSTDGTRELLDGLRDQEDLKILFHESNQGKGAALITGFSEATGDVVVIQDADMEYNPAEFRWLLQPILDGRADVVYGSRFSSADHVVSPGWHQAGNQFITRCCNFVTRMRFTDVETCYKMFRREVIQELAPTLREKRFGIEIEMTAKLARRGKIRFFERPISYARRSYAEGKKIGWRDGVRALWCIVRYGFGK
ncbi:MAG: glycosyltransferase family 2 protein [Pirellulaceae bacterium]